MRIITVNVNGLREAADKGFVRWMQRQKADVVCIQSTQASEHELAKTIARPKGFHAYFHDSRKGGSGVAMYCRREPDRVVRGFGWPEVDTEGRLIRADFGRLSVFSFYMRSGSNSSKRQRAKLELMERMGPFLRGLAKKDRDYIICGGWNIAHKEVDLANWRAHQKTSGFLPEERAWMDQVFNGLGFADAFRQVTDDPDHYTFWPSRGQAWEKNVGWRMDYQVISKSLADKCVDCSIYKKRRFSDHAPLTVDYAYAL